MLGPFVTSFIVLWLLKYVIMIYATIIVTVNREKN